MLSSLGKEKILEFIIEAISKENYYLAKIFASKPFRVSEVERIASENDGVIIGAAIIFGDADEVVSKVIRGEKPYNFIVVLDEEGLNNLHEFFERRKLEEKTEILATSEEIDTKIKETIKKYTPEEKEENIEIALKLVKEAKKFVEGIKGKKNKEPIVRERMVKVYKLGYNQKQTTEIFMADPSLEVDKNTFVVKRDVKEED